MNARARRRSSVSTSGTRSSSAASSPSLQARRSCVTPSGVNDTTVGCFVESAAICPAFSPVLPETAGVGAFSCDGDHVTACDRRRNSFRAGIRREQRMKQLIQAVATTIGVFGLAGAAFAGGDADRCSTESLHGEYVLSASGFTVNPVTGAAQPKAIVEVIDFDGDRTLAVPAATRSVNGAIARSLPGSRSYTVEADCSGTIVFDGGPSFDMFITPRGNQLWVIQTNPNNVFQGSATRTASAMQHRDQQ